MAIFKWGVLLVVLLMGAVALGAGIATAHDGGTEVRITAMRLDDGRIEFALQERDGEGWGERILPSSRFFPTTSSGRWLNSSPITVGQVASMSPSATAAPTATQPFTGSGALHGVIYVSTVDPFTDSRTTGVTISSSYVGDNGSDQHALLLVGCKEGALVAWVFTDEYHSKLEADGDSVTYRIDSQSAVTEQWIISGDLNTTVSPPDPASFVASLRVAQRLAVRTAETPVLTFDLSNLFKTPAQVNIDNCGE